MSLILGFLLPFALMVVIVVVREINAPFQDDDSDAD